MGQLENDFFSRFCRKRNQARVTAKIRNSMQYSIAPCRVIPYFSTGNIHKKHASTPIMPDTLHATRHGYKLSLVDLTNSFLLKRSLIPSFLSPRRHPARACGGSESYAQKANDHWYAYAKRITVPGSEEKNGRIFDIRSRVGNRNCRWFLTNCCVFEPASRSAPCNGSMLRFDLPVFTTPYVCFTVTWLHSCRRDNLLSEKYIGNWGNSSCHIKKQLVFANYLLQCSVLCGICLFGCRELIIPAINNLQEVVHDHLSLPEMQ